MKQTGAVSMAAPVFLFPFLRLLVIAFEQSSEPRATSRFTLGAGVTPRDGVVPPAEQAIICVIFHYHFS
jgi:hypothetical protein